VAPINAPHIIIIVIIILNVVGCGQPRVVTIIINVKVIYAQTTVIDDVMYRLYARRSDTVNRLAFFSMETDEVAITT